MTAQDNVRGRLPVSWSDRQLRMHGSAALRYAKRKVLASQADIASWNKQDVRTVREQLAGRSLLTFDVFRSGRLRAHILHYLSVCDRAVKKTIPHVARKRRGR